MVDNPIGLSLPPQQDKWEASYRRELKSRYDIEFSELHTITNLPISRFLDDRWKQGKLEEYLQTLIDNFHPLTVEGVMCRSMLSVDWQGRLFECDFNQMLNIELAGCMPRTIPDFDAELPSGRKIMTGRHCFGCTAGCGSSCQGAVLKTEVGQ